MVIPLVRYTTRIDSVAAILTVISVFSLGVFAAFGAVVACAEENATEFVVEPDAGSEVIFTSKAPLESFDGKTAKVSGTIVADLSQLVGTVEVELVVDLASLDTGIGLRNTHMRDNHLETEKFPVATFTGGEIVAAEPAQLVTGQSSRIRLGGTLDLHGVTQPREIEAVLELAADGVLMIDTEFPVSLKAHDIKRPKFLVMKLADEQQVRAKLRAVPAGE